VCRAAIDRRCDHALHLRAAYRQNAFSLLRNTARRFDFVTIWNNDPALRLEPG